MENRWGCCPASGEAGQPEVKSSQKSAASKAQIKRPALNGETNGGRKKIKTFGVL
ncbi:hypothetical protein [Algoriphagus yeomjeoni]|uniref:hypothetical protein n=1 Tax=Algoriphagus yeomjeoni TaxID=291403 RepID=UPI0013141076|nr:hypothetical protein [Algoriphagus yeomjeoni]